MPHQTLSNVEMIFRELACAIGSTPLLSIQCHFRGHRRTVYAKAEHLNLTGSIKDRVALHVLYAAHEKGMLQPGCLIAEKTGGNTGLAFAAVGRALGHPVDVFLDASESEERRSLVQRFGGRPVTTGPDGDNPPVGLAEAEEIVGDEGGAFSPHPLLHSASIETHERSTGPEVWYQMKARDSKPDAFVAGVGTGGTVQGTGRFLKSLDPAIRVHPIVATETPSPEPWTRAGTHRVPGMSAEGLTGDLGLEGLDSAIQVPDGDAILMTQALEDQLGLGLGASSGANFLGALLVQEELGPDSVVATVFPDDNRRYPSRDLSPDEPRREGFLSPEVRLTGYHMFRRSCRTCEDVEECRPWGAGIG